MSPTVIIVNDKNNVFVFTNENVNAKESKVDEEKEHIIAKESLRNSIKVDKIPVTMNELATRRSSSKSKKERKKKPVVLVVDDVASNRKMMHRLLQDRCEYSMDATNGVEAVAIIRDALSRGRHIDVITMDYQMPVMDGPTAT